MGNSQVMPKVDFQKENLKTAFAYSKFMQAKNLERYLTVKDIIFRKRVTLACSVTLVVGIYFFTIIKIKQETFLDDFEEPERVERRFAPLPTIKELLKLYNLRALKKLSQNFLLDKNLTDKIARVPVTLKDYEICEIGPGPGGITRSLLLQNPKKVLAIEKDTRFEPFLQALQLSSREKLDVIYCDIQKYDFSQAFDPSLRKNWEDEPPKIHIIGNLPFNISNLLIFEYLKDISLRRNAWSYGRVCLTLTFQEEVARRIVSGILVKTRSRISVMCQNWCKVSLKFTIPGCAFLPKVDVNVGVLHFEPLIRPIIDLDYALIEKVLNVIFNSRQKHSITPAKHLFPVQLQETLAKEMFELAHLEPTIRPYQIANEEWGRLCLAYKNICNRDPQLYKYNFRGPKQSREIMWREEVVSN